MPALQMGVKRHLNAFHHSVPLIFQFFLAELIQACGQFQNICTLITEEQFNHSLFALLARFCGQSPDHRQLVYWSTDSSRLSKLHQFASLLSSRSNSEQLPLLEKSTQKAWLLGIRLLTALEEQKISNLDTILNKLRRAMKQITKEAVKIFTIFQDDENVLYFVLRHRDQLDAIYEKNFTVQLFATLFPEGLHKAEKLITERYTSRGFNRLADRIRHHFDTLL